MRTACILVALVLANLILAARFARSRNPSWDRLFSPNPKEFVANLRRAHCPEPTVKALAVIEVNKRFVARDAVLRDQPGDHLPLGWPETSHGDLQRRRREARLLAREKMAMLRETLGYDVPVDLPTYALSAHDLK